jgi:hypothetical protein
MIICSSTVPRPVMYLVSKVAEANSGVGLMASLASVSTSETESTTTPTTRPAMLRMMTTVNSSYRTSLSWNLMRRSRMGTITPRRLITPLMKAGALAIAVGAS